MCVGCSKAHRRSRATRNHPQLDKENMPTDANVDGVQENCTEYCEQHPLKLIEYFCPEHESLLCVHCIIIDQHNCKVAAITNKSVNFKDSSAFKDIKLQINKLADDACKTTTALEMKAMDVDYSEQKNKSDVLDFKSTILECLNDEFDDLNLQITTTSQEVKVALTHLQEHSKMHEVEAIGLQTDLKESENNNVLLFISAYRSKGRAKAIPDRLHQIEEELKRIPTYEFMPSSKLTAALSGRTCVGIYTSSPDKLKQGSDEVGSDRQQGKFKLVPPSTL